MSEGFEVHTAARGNSPFRLNEACRDGPGLLRGMARPQPDLAGRRMLDWKAAVIGDCEDLVSARMEAVRGAEARPLCA